MGTHSEVTDQPHSPSNNMSPHAHTWMDEDKGLNQKGTDRIEDSPPIKHTE